MVHALELAVGPQMLRLDQAVIDVVLGTGVLEGVGAEQFSALNNQMISSRSREKCRGLGNTAVPPTTTVDFGSLGPVRRSSSEQPLRHLARALGFMP